MSRELSGFAEGPAAQLTFVDLELVHERDLLYTVMDGVPDFMYIKDESHSLTLINKALGNALRLHDVRDAVGKTDFDFFSAD